MDWDVFISHAWEDKESFARPLANALEREGLRVWFDEFTLTVGDSLRRSIDQGLANSRYGVVILSPHFFAKEWPQKELDGLAAREALGEKVVLPVWHNITAEQVRKYSPILADRVAVSSSRGLEHVVVELLRAMGISSERQASETALKETKRQGAQEKKAAKEEVQHKMAEQTAISGRGLTVVDVDKVELRRRILKTFDRERLEILCADISARLEREGSEVRVSPEIVGGRSLEAIILNLIEYLDRRGLLTHLLDAARKAQPGLI